MTTDTNPRLTARMCALNFVLANGDELPGGDDCDGLTTAFSEILLRLGGLYEPIWPSVSAFDRFHVARDAASTLLEELLESLNKRLRPYERFMWRLKLCRLILDYMGQRFGKSYERGIDHMLDHFVLVYHANNNAHWHRNIRLEPDFWFASDADEWDLTLHDN